MLEEIEFSLIYALMKEIDYFLIHWGYYAWIDEIDHFLIERGD